MARSILTKKQKELLEALFSQKNIRENFYLTGGTALAEYYLHHRYSEDLDFFSKKEFEPIDIQTILKTLLKDLGVQKIDFQQSFNRNLFYLYFKDSIIKTEFTYYPFEQIEPVKKKRGIVVDSLIDIAVNKAFTIYQKPRSRDFIDLYLILKSRKWKFGDIRKKAQIKFETVIDPLQLAQEIKEAETLKDYPRMIIPLSEKEWQEFWKKELEKLKSEVIK